VIAEPAHFLELARRARWDDADVDLRPDAQAWPGLPADVRRRLERLLAGFVVGEAGVAEHLGPFAAAATDPVIARCFATQERDEARHSRFFDRVAREVLRTPGETAADRRAALSAQLDPDFLDLFERRLPEVAGALADGETRLSGAVALYHMVLEGVVFTAGQLAALELLDELPELPGLRCGMDRVLRDERWHVGFGGRCLQDAGLDPDEIAGVLRAGEAAARCWADATGAEHAVRVVAMLRRRMAAVARAYAPSESVH
jgi:ribonucleoside-diphosphate reductase beta chain